MKLKIRSEFLMAAMIALSVSVISSFITYKITLRQVPKIAVADLVYLNTGYLQKLAQYLIDNNVADDQIKKIVDSHLSNIDTIVKDINHSGNYILLQKQTVLSEGLPDITKDLEKALFETVISQAKPGSKGDKMFGDEDILELNNNNKPGGNQ